MSLDDNNILDTITTDDNQPLLTPQESAEFLLWMTGSVKEPPLALQKVSNNLINKLNYGMSLQIASNMSRAMHLVEFIRESELHLFDSNAILTKEDDEVLNLYEKASKALNTALEFNRKYISQNKESLSPSNDKVDNLRELLLTLPKEKLDSLIDSLQKGEI